MHISTSWNRSVAKAFSWRLIATFTTMAIAYVITGKITLAVEIGFFEFFFKMVVYYFHERFWDNLKFGISIKQVPQQ